MYFYGKASFGALAVVGVGLVVWGIIQGNSSVENSKGEKRFASRKSKPNNNRPKRNRREKEVSEVSNEIELKSKKIVKTRTRRER